MLQPAMTPSTVTTTSTPNGPVAAPAEGVQTPAPSTTESWTNRFKVVRIGSEKPYQRGRWVCMDVQEKNPPPPPPSSEKNPSTVSTVDVTSDEFINPPVPVYNAAAAAQQDATNFTVAIDNKIEQAMDLVKSHLMFAVREEVDVLKEKITELMDRINKLEFENNLLRSHISPETLETIIPQLSSYAGQITTTGANTSMAGNQQMVTAGPVASPPVAIPPTVTPPQQQAPTPQSQPPSASAATPEAQPQPPTLLKLKLANDLSNC